MGSILARGSAHAVRNGRLRGACGIAFVVALAVSCTGCSRLKPVDTSPLETSGMGYNAIQQLNTLKITAAEVSEIAEARQGGFSDDDCVEILKLYRIRNHPFDAGDAVAGLLQVGMTDGNILDLARINELGLGWGELQAMKLAGMSNAIVMEEARQRASRTPVFSGASLARLKDAGMHDSTLLKLVQMGVPDSQARAIIAYRHRGVSEAEIVRHFGEK
ncbi:MAG: hypothetical protein ACRD5K_18345 [Candidatus Acidiferrales bacterium]